MSLETKAAAVAAASVAGVSLSLEWFGVPANVVLAAFLGAAAILSFLPPMPLRRMLGTVVFCTMTAIYAGPLAVRNVEWLASADMLAALGIAALLQLMLPWAIENRGRIFDWLISLLPARKGGGE